MADPVGMDLQKFLGEVFVPREETITVPELAAYFADGSPAEWTVRGLNASELARAELASQQGGDNARALISAFAGDGDKAEAMRKLAGVSEADAPADVARRIDMLATGSVAPLLGADNREGAVKLAETFPTTFYTLTNKILTLTGQGADVGKRKRSGTAEK